MSEPKIYLEKAKAINKVHQLLAKLGGFFDVKYNGEINKEIDKEALITKYDSDVYKAELDAILHLNGILTGFINALPDETYFRDKHLDELLDTLEAGKKELRDMVESRVGSAETNVDKSVEMLKSELDTKHTEVSKTFSEVEKKIKGLQKQITAIQDTSKPEAKDGDEQTTIENSIKINNLKTEVESIQIAIKDLTSKMKEFVSQKINYVRASGVGFGSGSATWGDITGTLSSQTDLQTALNAKESTANKGVADGYASLDGSGKVPASQLPSYVDDVLEYANLAAFPGSGTTGVIYVALDTNKTYRWSGSAYVEISSSPGSTDAVTEGATNLYFTNERAQDAVGGALTDSSEIDFTYDDAAGTITATIKTGSIDESKLDASTNASLNLADTAVQPADIASFETTTQLNTRDTNNRNRANHTGTQLAATISDFASAVAALITGKSDVGHTHSASDITSGTKTSSFISDFSSAVAALITGKLDASAYDDATAAETDTGTSTSKYVSPDGLAGSNYGKRVVGILVVDPATDVATGDGKAFFRVPATLNGWNLVAVAMNVYTAGTTGTMDVQIRNVTDSQDMLSTKLTIDSTETDTSTAATAAVINTTYDDVATGDKIAIDVDAVQTTKAKGLYVELTFQLP